MPSSPPITRAANPLQALRNQLSVWPRRAVLAWWVVKPAATLAGISASIVHLVTGRSVLGGVLAVLVVVLVRPVARPWLGLLAGVGVGLLVPAAGIAVVVRTLAGIAGVRLAADTWFDGLGVVTLGRRVLLEVHSLDDVWAEFGRTAEQTGTDKEDFPDHVTQLVLAAWCTGDARKLASTVAEVFTGLTTGRWRLPVSPPFVARMLRLVVSEELVDVGCQLVAMTAVAVAVWSFGLASLTQLFGVGIPGWVTIAPAVLVAWCGVHRKATAIVGVSLMLAVAAAFVLYGRDAIVVLVLGAAVAIPVRLLCIALEQRLIGRRNRVPRLPVGPGWLAARDRWSAARRAVLDGRLDVARKLWSELAEDPDQHAATQAAAAAALAGLALHDGVIQTAVDWANEALRLLPSKARSRAQVWASAGRAMLAAGDTKKASDLLDMAVKDRGYRTDPQVVAARAQTLALTDADHPETLEELSGLARGSRLDQLIDTEVAMVTSPANPTPFAAREERLLELLPLLESFDDPEIADATVRVRISTSLARGWLALGWLQLDNRKPSSTTTSLRRAVSGLAAPAQALEQAVARTLLGVTLSEVNPSEAMTKLAAGVRELERRRGQLTAGKHRSQLIGRHANVYGHVFETCMNMQEDDPLAGLLAAELGESLRRNALARTLRGQRLEMTPQLQDVLNRIEQLESQDAADDAGKELQECRGALQEQHSERFASAYLPEPVDYDRLRVRVGGAHVLSYYLDVDSAEGVCGYVVWTPPQKVPVVTRFDVRDSALLALLGARGVAERNTVMQEQQKPDKMRPWQQLATKLLPTPLRTELLKLEAEYPASIVVVPDGSLAALPWAALRLDDGRPLVTVAILQLVPTLDLLDERPTHSERMVPAGHRHVLTHLNTNIKPTDGERTLSVLGTTTSTQAEFLEGLFAGALHGAYLAVHGNDEGLSQYVRFADDSRLSAATALMHRWPKWVIFASCLVGQVSVDLGQEPIGLPISCLLGGARTVVGGVLEIHSERSGPLASKVARRLLDGEHPARALRTEQLAVLAERSTSPRPYVWAGLICLSLAQPAT